MDYYDQFFNRRKTTSFYNRLNSTVSKTLADWGKKKIDRLKVKGLVTIEMDPNQPRSPSPVDMGESALKTNFNRELWHNIPVVVTQTIEQIIEELERSRIEIAMNQKRM